MIKRVPERYQGVVKGQDGQPVGQVRVALRTDSESKARKKAVSVEEARIAEWEVLIAGDAAGARAHYLAAKRLAESRGYTYVPVQKLADGPIEEIVGRVLSLIPGNKYLATPAVAEAVLGTVPEVSPNPKEVLDEFIDLTRTRHLQKSDAQRHKWLLPRKRTVANFLTVAAGVDAKVHPRDMTVNEIIRAHALAFRAGGVTV